MIGSRPGGLGVVLVVSFDPDRSECSHTAAYAAEGLAHYPLRALCDGGAGASLQSLDRFIALAAAAPGPVAVQWRHDYSASAAATHLAALLLRRGSFATAGQALAWIRMVRPDVPTGPVDLQLLDSDWASPATDPGGPPRPRRRRRSLSACARLVPASATGPAASAGAADASGAAGSGLSESLHPSDPSVAPVLPRPAISSAAAPSALLWRAHSSPGVFESLDASASAPAEPDWADPA